MKHMILEPTTWFHARLNALRHDECGQSVTEYAVVMAVITLIALIGISVTGVQALDVFRTTANSLR